MPLPPPENPLDAIANCIAFGSKDWSLDKRDAWIYGIVLGWDNEDKDEDESDEDAMGELQSKFGWSDEDVERLRRLHVKYNELMVLENYKGP
jgi:hypothetical protein